MATRTSSPRTTVCKTRAFSYIQKGVDGAPEVFLDPNKFSADGTWVSSAFSLSKDGKYVAYGISQGGSDWANAQLDGSRHAQKLDDELKWMKRPAFRGRATVSTTAAIPSRKRAGARARTSFKRSTSTRSARRSHKTSWSMKPKSTRSAFRVSARPKTSASPFSRSPNEAKGKKGNSLFYKDLESGRQDFLTRSCTRSATTVRRDHRQRRRQVSVRTDKNAPNGRVVLVDPKNPDEKTGRTFCRKNRTVARRRHRWWKTFRLRGGRTSRHAPTCQLDGKLENEIELPGVGTAGGFGGLNDDKHVFYSFTSFNFPPTIYKYDIATGKSTVFRAVEIPGFKAGDYETKQVFYNSKDGTRVPMFLVHKKGLKLDGNNPTLLYGYGGFNVVVTPGFSALRPRRGSSRAASTRRQHARRRRVRREVARSGQKLKKQNVFDDFIAAAEWLIANKYTSPSSWRSGRHRTAVCSSAPSMTQRPELFGAASRLGVMDMLRFHKFTIGWNWIADYGSSETRGEFKALYAYSPIHNIKPGAKYPATLITTADHDDGGAQLQNHKDVAGGKGG